MLQCALCKNKQCYKGQNCLGLQNNQIEAEYDELDRQLITVAAKIEGRYYRQLSRLE